MEPESSGRPVIRYVFVALAVMHLANGLFMLVDPGGFYEHVATFGTRNDHFTRDLASFVIAYGALLAIAAARPSWRPAAVAFGMLQYTVHVINHIFDVDQASSNSLGVANAITLAAGLAVLMWLAIAVRAEQRSEA